MINTVIYRYRIMAVVLRQSNILTRGENPNMVAFIKVKELKPLKGTTTYQIIGLH
jgi:hypothetical protein